MLKNISIQNIRSSIIIGIIGGIIFSVYILFPLKLGWFNSVVVFMIWILTIYLSMKKFNQDCIFSDTFISRTIIGSIATTFMFIIYEIINFTESVALIEFLQIIIASFSLGFILSSIISALISLKRKFFNIV